MKIEVVFKAGLLEVAKVRGIVEVPESSTMLDDLRRLLETESLLEKFMGLRVHINQI